MASCHADAVSEPLLDLDLASAHLYLSIVDLGSISKAAARHGLSQPSASQRVRKLERQLGLTLLDRSASGSTLTPDGREVARWCRDVVEAAAFARPCAQYGERVEAAVRLSAASGATAEELRALCVERVGKFKAPEIVHIMDELPKGPSGKIQRLYLNEALYGKG